MKDSMEYRDYMIRAIAADDQIRAFAVTSRDLVEEARRAHNTGPIATAALGRLMSGALMMSDMLKNEGDLLTLQVRGDGPLGGIVVTAGQDGTVKGYVFEPGVVLPPNASGHLNVGGAVGRGTLTVIRDLDMKNTYTGQVELVSGEIAEDLTQYFAESEQIPSSVGLGVLMNRDNTVRAAGGFIVQAMPSCSDDVLVRLEESLRAFGMVTDYLREGHTPEEMLEEVLGGLGMRVTDKRPVRFACSCSRERVARVLVTLGKDELDGMIREGKPVELGCRFCGRKYTYSVGELAELRASLTGDASAAPQETSR